MVLSPILINVKTCVPGYMKNFSFFSTHKKHRDFVLKSFENLIMDNRKVNVELTKKGKIRKFSKKT